MSTGAPCVVMVDPYSTGALLAQELDQRSYAVIAMWTADSSELRWRMPKAAKGFPEKFFAEVDEQATVALTADLVRDVAQSEPLAVICGGDTGVKLTDALSEYMGLRGNTTAGGVKNRRDKQMQQEAVKSAGLRSTRSVCGHTWWEVKGFTEAEEFPIIVKPLESSGNQGVKLCHTEGEAETHFHRLANSQRKGGPQREAIILQEYLKGAEYMVDCVSRDGVHKSTMVWVTDHGPANGSDFVLFGIRCVPSGSPLAQELIAYVHGCLEALRITDGATHTEVMMTETGPCLVEVNSRCHGANGSWMPLALALTGYTQVEACVDAFMNAEAFDRLPHAPPDFMAFGILAMLLSYHEGHAESTCFDKVRELQSVVFLEEQMSAGRWVKKSTDMPSLIGMCVLVHADPTVVERDLEAIREMEQEGSLYVLAD